MSEPEAPPPIPKRGIHWPRCRIYFWAILLVMGLWLLGTVYSIRFTPSQFINQALAQLPFPASAGQAEWINDDTLLLRNVKLGKFFYADTVIINAKLRDLLRHHVKTLKIYDTNFYMSEFDKELAQSKGGGGGLDWTIGELTIRRGVVSLNFGAQMPPVQVTVGSRRPVILNHLHLGTPDHSKSMTEERVVELENIHFASPYDALSPVLNLPLVRIEFTYEELWRHRLRRIDLVRPNLFLGQDLFWFTDEIKKERAREAATGPEAPWEIGQFAVEYGRLSVNTFGQPRLNFPFFFDTEVNEIRLDQLDKISVKSVIAIRHFTKDYPEYKIKINDLHGKIEFSLPPSDAKANNVVTTLDINSISWNDIAVTKPWISVTFDPTGIYAKMGGNCEKGLMDGNFEVYYTKGFQWNADLFAHALDCAPIAEKMAGKYGSLTGTLNGKIAITGKGTTIEKCAGTLTLDKPGELRISALDKWVKDLPPSMAQLKKQALKIGASALSYYAYETGSFNVDYTPATGSAALKLDGPSGKRDFSIYWHPFDGSEVAKAGETH